MILKQGLVKLSYTWPGLLSRAKAQCRVLVIALRRRMAEAFVCMSRPQEKPPFPRLGEQPYRNTDLAA
jgi:hypothetical protein